VGWLRRGHDPLSTAVRQVGGSVLGTYLAYVLYGLTHPAAGSPLTGPEDAYALPGDGLVVQPDSRKTFLVEIAAKPEVVWGFLVQMGFGRAGWYTWWPFDNGGVASAEAVVPDLQQLAVGDAVPDGPRAAEGYGLWRVLELAPPQTLVFFSRRRVMDGLELATEGEVHGPHAQTAVACSWVFHIVATPTGCRLYVRVITRLLGGAPGAFGRLVYAIVDRGDTAMEWTTLQGIKQRAEALTQAG
jgi:hypothetical protein